MPCDVEFRTAHQSRRRPIARLAMDQGSTTIAIRSSTTTVRPSVRHCPDPARSAECCGPDDRAVDDPRPVTGDCGVREERRRRRDRLELAPRLTRHFIDCPRHRFMLPPRSLKNTEIHQATRSDSSHSRRRRSPPSIRPLSLKSSRCRVGGSPPAAWCTRCDSRAATSSAAPRRRPPRASARQTTNGRPSAHCSRPCSAD